jgi:hypothetical protein
VEVLILLRVAVKHVPKKNVMVDVFLTSEVISAVVIPIYATMHNE